MQTCAMSGYLKGVYDMQSQIISAYIMLILSHCVIIVWHHQMELGENSDSPYEMPSELIMLIIA